MLPKKREVNNVSDKERLFNTFHNDLNEAYEGYKLYKENKNTPAIAFALKKAYFLSAFVGDIIENEHPGIDFIHTKTQSDVMAIYDLIIAGGLPQAAMVMRSLYETAVNMQYISNDYDKRIELFWNHRVVEDYYKMKKHREFYSTEYKGYKNILYAKFQASKHEYELSKPWYYRELLDDIGKHPLNLNYKKPSLKTMTLFIDSRYGRMYETIYGWGSGAIHGSSSSTLYYVSDDYTNKSRNSSFTGYPVFNKDLSWIIRTTALDLTRDILVCILEKKVKEDIKYQAYVDFINDEFAFYKEKTFRPGIDSLYFD